MSELDCGLFDTTAIPDTSPAETAAAFEQHLGDAQLAERSGYHSFFFIEHQNPGFACITAPAPYLAALALATNTIRIGTMIFQVPLHHPIRLAQDTATVDHLSHGRLDVGLGFGTRTREFEPWHIDFKDRRAQGCEAIEVLLKAWTERVVDHAGEHFTFTGATPQPHPYQQPHPPVWMGAHSISSYEYAAKMNFNVGQIFESETVAAEKFAHWRKELDGYAHPGPRRRAALVRHVHVAETDELAREQAEQYMPCTAPNTCSATLRPTRANLRASITKPRSPSTSGSTKAWRSSAARPPLPPPFAPSINAWATTCSS